MSECLCDLVRPFCEQLYSQFGAEEPEYVTIVLDGKTYTPKLAKLREFACSFDTKASAASAREGIQQLIQKVLDGEMG